MNKRNSILDEEKDNNALDSFLDIFVEKKEDREAIKKTSEISVIYASSGALIGSVVPVIGTALGAVLGATAGGIVLVGNELNNRSKI